MKAVRVQPVAQGAEPYSETNPPPPSSLVLAGNIPMPKMEQPGDLIVQIKASTVIRDSLTWPEVIADKPSQMGNDFSGIVMETFNNDTSTFRPGEEVYGMTAADRGETWAEFAYVKREEAFHKPKNLSWEEAAALPLSTLTADQALFKHCGLEIDGSRDPKRVLITGAAGGVGNLLVQFAGSAGHHVVAATSSNARNADFLKTLGASETIEYSALKSVGPCDAIVDTVGGDVLQSCWPAVKDDGAIVTIDSGSYDFPDSQQEQRKAAGKKDVRGLFFIVEPSRASMERISTAVAAGKVSGSVAQVLPFEDARKAYELAHDRKVGRGKVVLKF